MGAVIPLRMSTATPKVKRSRGYDYTNLKRFTKSQISGLTKKLGGLRFNHGWNDRRKIFDNQLAFANSVGLDIDYNDFHSASGERFSFLVPRKITSEQTKFGKAWLKNYFFRLDGTPRKGKRTEYVDERVLEIVKQVSRFEFVGVFGGSNGFGELVHFIPIYRTYSRDGRYFDYAPVHWGEPLISYKIGVSNE